MSFEKSTILVAFILLSSSNGQKCTDGNSKVDLVFVVDRTPTPGKLADHPGSLLNDVQESIAKRFPGSRFGLTLFSDFTNKQKGAPTSDLDAGKADETNSCYKLKSSLKDDLDYQTALQGVKIGPDGGKGQESVLTGILYTAADKNIGWTKNHYDDNALGVIKMVAFITGSESLSPSKPDQVHTLPTKSAPKGDGKDDCDNFGLPSKETINSVLQAKQIAILGILTTEAVIPYWKKELEELNGIQQDTMKLTVSEQTDPTYASQVDDLTEKIASLIGKHHCFLDPPGKNTYGL